MPKCNQCDSATINGVYCHETGCPNQHSRYDSETEEWIAQYTCFECGFKTDIGAVCCGGEE